MIDYVSLKITKITNIFTKMFVIYLRILKIIVNNLQSWQLSVYFLKINQEVCKIFENNIWK